MKPFYAFLLLGFGSCVIACGNAQSNVLDGPDGGPDTGTGLSPLTCADGNVTSIGGTWDVLTSTGSSLHPQITIDATSFAFRNANDLLSYRLVGTALALDWTSRARRTPIATTHAGSAVDMGLLPLAAGGEWTFADDVNIQKCTASVRADAFNASCNGVKGTPIGTLDGTLLGQRTSKRASLFGELGGTWHFVTGGAVMDVTIAGNEFSVTSNGSGRPVGTGSLSIKVCNGTLTGITSSGVEISGVRQ